MVRRAILHARWKPPKVFFPNNFLCCCLEFFSVLSPGPHRTKLIWSLNKPHNSMAVRLHVHDLDFPGFCSNGSNWMATWINKYTDHQSCVVRGGGDGIVAPKPLTIFPFVFFLWFILFPSLILFFSSAGWYIKPKQTAIQSRLLKRLIHSILVGHTLFGLCCHCRWRCRPPRGSAYNNKYLLLDALSVFTVNNGNIITY